MANEKRLIDANALIEALPIVTEDRKITLYGAVADFMIMISAMPTVDAVEVVHGQWEPREDVKGFVRCSVCHDCNIYDDWADEKKWNYCPNCGADMRGSEE